MRWLGGVLVVLVAGAPAMLRGAEPLEVGPVPEGMAVRSSALESQGRFELIFSERAGGISAWYDLDRDPQRTCNLAGHGDLPTVALVTHALTLAGSQWKEVLYSAPAETLNVPEDDAVRVQLCLEGSYSPLAVAEEYQREGRKATPAGVPSRSSPIHFVTTYTVYPVGQLYVRHTLTAPPTTLKVASSEWLLSTAPTSDFRTLGSVSREAGAGPDFLLQTSNGPVHFGDVLLIPGRPGVPVTRWGERFLLGAVGGTQGARGATRSGFEMHPPGTILGSEPSVWCCALHVEPDWVDRAELASAVAEAYQRPPSLTVEPGWGELLRGEGGDLNLDGYCEGEGCYTLRASPAGCRLTLDLSHALLTSPVFRFAGWQGPPPPTILVNGKRWSRGENFQAVLLNASTLLLQLYENRLSGQVTMEVTTGLARPRTSAPLP